MYRKTTYQAERAEVSSDGKHVRIVKERTGQYAPEDAKHVARLREEQARDLRNSLNDVLSEMTDEVDR